MSKTQIFGWTNNSPNHFSIRLGRMLFLGKFVRTIFVFAFRSRIFVRKLTDTLCYHELLNNVKIAFHNK